MTMQAIKVSGESETIDYTRPGSDVPPGHVEISGTIAGVDVCGGLADEVGSLAISGVFNVQKITEVSFTVGATVYWNATATPQGSGSGTGAATSTVEDYVLGICVEATGTDDDERVLVRLQQYEVPSS